MALGRSNCTLISRSKHRHESDDRRSLNDAAGAFCGKEECERLSFWSGGGRHNHNSHSFLPLGHDRITFIHRHGSVLGEHLWALAAAPRQKVQEVIFTHTLSTSWSVCFGLTAFDHTGEFTHPVSLLP